MGQIVRLHATGGSLHIDIGPDGWSRCYLIIDKNIYLGAESISYLVGRLILMLKGDEEEAIGEIYGYKVSWILSLNEAHSSLYAASSGSGRILFWQDAGAGVIGKMELSETDRLEWRRQLKRLV